MNKAHQKSLVTLHRCLPFLVAILWFVLFAKTFLDLWQRWIQWDRELAHGIPVMGIFIFLLWKAGAWRSESLINPAAEMWCSAMALVGVSLLWLLALAVNIQIIEQLLLLPILVFAYSLIYGWGAIWRHRLLLLFPIFAIPVWGSLNGALLGASSAVVGQMVRWAEMPALIQGSSIYLPYGHILIADGCSGLRYFVIALTLGYLLAYLNGYKGGKLLLTIAVAVVLGLITNWIRIFVLIVIGYKTRMESGLIEDHEVFGWLLFAAICLPALFLAPVTKTDYRNGSGGLSSGKIDVPRLVTALSLLALGPAFSLWLHWSFTPAVVSLERAQVHYQPLPEMPLNVTAPSGATTAIERLNSHVYWRRDTYQRKSLEDKLVPYWPGLFDHEEWYLTKDTFEVVGGHQLSYQTFRKKRGSKLVAQLQWLNVGGRLTASPLKAKFLQIPATLRRQNHFAILTLQASCRSSDCEQTKSRLIEKAGTLLSSESK